MEDPKSPILHRRCLLSEVGGRRGKRHLGLGSRFTAPFVLTTSVVFWSPPKKQNHPSATSRHLNRDIAMAARSQVLSAEWYR